MCIYTANSIEVDIDNSPIFNMLNVDADGTRDENYVKRHCTLEEPTVRNEILLSTKPYFVPGFNKNRYALGTLMCYVRQSI